MLHGVHIEVSVGQGLVGLDVVVEFDDFDVEALFRRFFGDFFHDFCMGTGGDATLISFLSPEAAESLEEPQPATARQAVAMRRAAKTFFTVISCKSYPF